MPACGTTCRERIRSERARAGVREHPRQDRIDTAVTDVERFFRNVDAEGDCWEWIGPRQSTGYGTFNPARPDRKSVRAHRWVWEYLVGPIPDGLEMDHLCKVRYCVNPDHLEPVTRSENVRRIWTSNKRHCLHGHAYTEANTYREPKTGKRHCATCRNAVTTLQNARAKARRAEGRLVKSA